MAEMFGVRPSTLLSLDEPGLAFQVDEALFVRLRLAQQEERDRQRHGKVAPRGIRRFGPPPEIFDLPEAER